MHRRFLLLVLLVAAVLISLSGSRVLRERRPTSQHQIPASLRTHMELLQAPGRAWSGRSSDSFSRFRADPELEPPLQNKRMELQKMLTAYAPRIWWHPADPFGPMDPIDFLKESSLWLKRGLLPAQTVAAKGEINPLELGFQNKGVYARHVPTTWSLIFGGAGPFLSPAGLLPMAHAGAGQGPADNHEPDEERNYFLKYENETLGTREQVDWSLTALGARSYQKPIEQGQVPVLWKVSASPAARMLSARADPGHTRVLVEYWYHLAYSHATSYVVGNHQGDWEGIAVLVDLSVDAKGALRHKPLALFYAQHSGGTWHCPSEINWVEGHPEAHTALGTHATYAAEGNFQAGLITDRTAKGRHWDSWNLVRPMVLEPYYGYAGSWGEAGFLPFMSGPAAPSLAKNLPGRSIANNSQTTQELIGRCSL